MRSFLLLPCAVMCMSCCGCLSVSPPAVRFPDDYIVYQPAPYPQGNWKPENLVYEDVNFEAADGTKLNGWFCPAENPRAVVLFAHGNAGNVSHRIRRMKLFQGQLHVSTFYFDYRGYGRSEGLPSERGVLMDARAARKWLSERTGVPEREIVMAGESLGGAVAIDLAAKDGAAGLVLESTFTSLPDVASSLFPYTPARYLLRNRFDSISKIGQYEGPLLVFHGDADKLIPIEQSRKLLAAAKGPKSMTTIPGEGHNWSPTPEYMDQLDRFFTALQAQHGDDVAVRIPPPN